MIPHIQTSAIPATANAQADSRPATPTAQGIPSPFDNPPTGDSLASLRTAGQGVAQRLASALAIHEEGQGAQGLPRSNSSGRLQVEPDATSPLQPRTFLSPQVVGISDSHAPLRSFGRARRRLVSATEAEQLRALFEPQGANAPNRGAGTHYLQLKPAFELLVDGEYKQPEIFQPTPQGLRTLIEAHTRNNHVDFRVHEKGSGTADRVEDRVAEFLETAPLDMLSANHPVGTILSFDQMHAIPIFLAMRDDKKYLLILDSTSGPIQQQYWAVARRFPDFEVRLNAGTRQADNQSCINDAFEILKQCFTVGNLIERVESKRLARADTAPARPSNSRLRIARPTQPDNFSLFNLPEELAYVVQRAKHLEESEVDMERLVTVEGRTCPLSMHVTISTDFGQKTRPDAAGVMQTEPIKANIYLYQASQRHRDIIEDTLRETVGQ